MFAWVLEKSHGTRGHPGREPWASARRLTDATDPHPHDSPRSAPQPIRVSGDLLLPVERLAREKPLRCGPATTIRHAASLMSRRHRGAALVEDGGVQGIVTDADLRDKVLAAGLSPEAPVGMIMSRPVVTVPAGTPIHEAAAEMLVAGIRHLPVVDDDGRVIALVAADDFLTADESGPLALFRAVQDAADEDAVAAAAAGLPALFCGLVDAGLEPAAVSHILTIQHDAMTRRLIDLSVRRHGTAPVDFAWLALGSAARGELSLVSDQDNALAYAATDDPAVESYFRQLARDVNRGLTACGFAADISGVLAREQMWRHPIDEWVRIVERCLDVPNRSHLMRATIAFDLRQVAGELPLVPAVAELMATAPRHSGFLAALAGTVTEIPSPLGFRRRLAGAVDLKKRGLVPIVNLARYFTLSEGIVCSGTAERLERLARSEVLHGETVEALRDAYATIARLRMVRHAELVRTGAQPSNVIGAESLPRLTRAGLLEALRVVRDAQCLLPPPLHGW